MCELMYHATIIYRTNALASGVELLVVNGNIKALLYTIMRDG